MIFNYNGKISWDFPTILLTKKFDTLQDDVNATKSIDPNNISTRITTRITTRTFPGSYWDDQYKPKICSRPIKYYGIGDEVKVELQSS